MKTYRILNLGAGVQSTTLALMSKVGEVERYDYAVFADTQSEPRSVYKHLDWLISELDFPVIIDTAGSLRENIRSGIYGDMGRYISIPAFVGDEKREGIVQRHCTAVYKIDVVERAIRRKILGIPKHARWPKGIHVTQSFGLSYDEPQRVFKVRTKHATKPWGVEFPLFDMEMSRSDCEKWLLDYGVPHKTPRSACTFCPYRSDREWNAMKQDDPESFADAVLVDEMLRSPECRASQGFEKKMWVHRSCTPLATADFSGSPKDIPGQSLFGFSSECEGMCGI